MLFSSSKNKTPEQKLAAAVAIPTTAVDKRYSAISSFEQQPGTADRQLMELGLACIKAALDTDQSALVGRLKAGQTNYFDIYPGEHYKLLAGIIKHTQPKVVIELGTHLGYSALCMKQYLPEDGIIHTFDVIPWNGFADTILQVSDFGAQLQQHTADLTDMQEVVKMRGMLENADIVFMDALKDGIQEYKFLENFRRLNFRKPCLFIFDDIRLWNMLDIWYHLEKPKLDLTSFGHWSGTGLVRWG